MWTWHTRKEAEEALKGGLGCQLWHEPNDRGIDLKVVELDDGTFSICCNSHDCIEDMLMK